MGYHLDFAKMGLADLRRRLEAVEPIPSQLPLLEGIGSPDSARLVALARFLEKEDES